jgi:hypothetical protein
MHCGRTHNVLHTYIYSAAGTITVDVINVLIMDCQITVEINVRPLIMLIM